MCATREEQSGNRWAQKATQREGYKMFNQQLPIFEYREKITKAVRGNSVVIITAETGAGKSTQVPQYLLAEDYNLVVTQPRRLASRTVAARVAEEIGVPLGETVGFRNAYERNVSDSTRCLFATDGLAMVRELMGVGRHNVLVLDEVHEWNLNIEVLVAWAKRQIMDNAAFKVVLMSATLEADRLSAHFGGAPVIDVPGRAYPVEERSPSFFVSDVSNLLRQGRNVLVFQPGKREISEMIGELTNAIRYGDLNAEVLPLHGELTPEEQAACFKRYGRPKCVVATNVAQTSVTIADIDAVVDGGVERRIELVDGIEGLYLKPISLADRVQRKGRAGRTKPGIYIDHCEEPYDERPKFPKAEILRVRLDQTVLRLAEAGIDAEALEFFHQPDLSEIHEAKRALVALGCMRTDGTVTEVGRRVAKMPISVKYARMVVEAERLGVVDDVVTIAAILEVRGITVRQKDWREEPAWRKLVKGETESDLMAQLEIWNIARTLKSNDEMRERGIFVKSFYRGKEIRRHLVGSLKGKVKFGSTGNRHDILKAVCAGMVDHLYKHTSGGYLQNGGDARELGRESVVKFRGVGMSDMLAGGPPPVEWVVGEPLDLEIKTRFGTRTLMLVTMASKIHPSMLAEVAPQLVSTSLRNYRYSRSSETVVADEVTTFNGQKTETWTVEAPTCAEATAALAQTLMKGETGLAVEWHNAAVRETLDDLSVRSNGAVRPLSDQQLQEFYLERIGESKSLAEIAGLDLELDLELYAPAEIREEIDRLNPKTIQAVGHEVHVIYRTGYNPKVVLPSELVSAGIWKALPDEGIFLPSGRNVEIEISFGLHTKLLGSNLRSLKEQVREHLNYEQWNRWFDKPEVPLPAVTEETTEIPSIVEAMYGTDALTGEPLVGYGTANINDNRWSSTDPYFRAEWFTKREDAEAARSHIIAKIEENKAEMLRQLRRSEVVERALELAELLNGYYSRYFSTLPYDLKRQMPDYLHAPSSSGVGYIERWMTEAEAMRERVEDSITGLREQTAKAEYLRNQARELLEGDAGNLSDEDYDELHRVANTTTSQLVSLESWITKAEAVIARANAVLTRPDEWESQEQMQAALEGLAKRFRK
jgi:HrpA-like RNA helicase